MGNAITIIRKQVEGFAKADIHKLSIGGVVITFLIVGISGSIGWTIEQLTTSDNAIISICFYIVLVIGLASCLAAGSLRKSVLEVLNAIPKTENTPNLELARNKLKLIVGRDVSNISKQEILRATAETASENSVDGIFGPLFWMLMGCLSWSLARTYPGPLALVLAYKGSSTIDSMIGYKYGTLRWLGTFGARLEDYLTWLPCRLVVITLPLIEYKSIGSYCKIIRSTFLDGAIDKSPNSGLSEAIYAYCLDIKMGGENRYQGITVAKNIINRKGKLPSHEMIEKILNYSLKLELSWIIVALLLSNLKFINQ